MVQLQYALVEIQDNGLKAKEQRNRFLILLSVSTLVITCFLFEIWVSVEQHLAIKN